MKSEDINLVELLDFRPESGQILLNGHRMLMFSQRALATLRELIVTHLGHEFAAAILTQFGNTCGREDFASIAAESEWDSDADRIASGPVLHSWEGIVHVTPTALEYDRTTGEFLMAGQWRNSYEAQNYRRSFGPSEHPVCWSLAGYASGWSSAFFGAELLAIETSCTAMGDDLCRFEIRPRDRWGPIADPWRRAQSATPESVTSYMEELVTARTAELAMSNQRLSDARDAAERANRVKGQFLANISHELRTPMNGVVGLAEVLRDSDLDDDQRRLVDLIIDSAAQEVAVVSDILDYATIESATPVAERSPVDLDEVLSAMVSAYAPLAATKGVLLLRRPSPDAAPTVLTDRGKLKQILATIVSNAIKFTPPAGSVELYCRVNSHDVAIAIADTGIGISEDAVEELFAPFEQADVSRTRRFGGTGLGLAICRELASVIGARVEVSSVLGEGSTFLITLPGRPIAASAATGGTQALHPAHLSGKGDGPAGSLKVLVADDNRINALVISRLLQSLDCQVTAVGDGMEAIAAFDSGEFDLVVLDLHMPEADGIDVVRHIRRCESAAHAPPHYVAALTADAFAETRERCLAAGFSDFLTKPIRKERALQLVADASVSARSRS
ncbi:MAG: ATP-binding protein [Candidatus Nanopelagicales bacterium]